MLLITKRQYSNCDESPEETEARDCFTLTHAVFPKMYRDAEVVFSTTINLFSSMFIGQLNELNPQLVLSNLFNNFSIAARSVYLAEIGDVSSAYRR